jgi:hypothetical protein
MRALLIALFVLAVAPPAGAGPCPGQRAVDLRSAAALEQLQRLHPGHFAVIRQILAGLAERPARVEEGWLQTEFAVQDVSLSGLLLHTSNPPKQLLTFTLENTRYTMYLTRSDRVAAFMRAVGSRQ